MLRQVADMNINRLLLPRFTKEGDRLKMEYHCLLSESHPHKIVTILQNICRVGDKYDDEFCTKFGATRCYEPKVTPYPTETVDRIYDAMQSLIQTTLDAIKEYNDQRRYGYSWNVIDTAFYQISYFAQPQGQLANDLDKAVNDMDEELPVAELVMKGMAYLQKLQATPKEKIAEDLYFVDTLVSIKGPSSLQNVQENMKDVYEEATAAMQNKDYERAAVRICYKFYEAYFYNDMQDDLNAIFVKALREAAEYPMEEAADILWTALDKVMEGEIEEDDEAGFFSGAMDNPMAKQMMEQAAASANAMQQKMAEAMGGDEVQALQQKMVEAMNRGDMAEYMRLAGELQQKMMSGLFNN